MVVCDEKRGINIAEIIHTSTFDKDTYEKILQKAHGVFSAENHPEWSTKQKVSKWVAKNRLSDHRSF